MNRNQRKTVVGLFGGISAILFVIILFILAPSNRQKPKEDKEKESVLIFTATKFFGLDMPAVKNAFVRVCSQDIQDYCHLTSDPEHFDKADAVLYHQPEYDPEVHQFPRNRDQIQVMLSLESPHYYNIKFKPGFMNWTMTYRLDSDVPFPYAVMKQKKKNIVTDFDAIWTQKNHSLTAAWMVANCDAPNRRKELVEAAQLAGLNVDILGMCGKRLEGCDREAEDRYDCAARTLRHYKFYFALENTNCQDYVTEKFFNSLRIYNSVPIVIRREYYTNIGIPNDAFIALDDFDSMTDFVNFLDRVKVNSTEYLKYHAWRDHYDVAEYDRTTGFCLLCEKLKQPSRQSRNYHDLHNWFSKDMCDNNYADRFL